MKPLRLKHFHFGHVIQARFARVFKSGPASTQKQQHSGQQPMLVRDFRFWDRPISPIGTTWNGESAEPQATMFIRLCPRLQVFVPSRPGSSPR